MDRDYERIATVLEYIHANHERQPQLEELAQVIGLSPFHLQRMFRRWAGVSPKQFLQCVTVDHARSLLTSGHDVLDTTLEVGLSSPGRLHDLTVTLDAVTPGEYRNGGKDLSIEYGVHDSPYGHCFLAVTERGVCRFEFFDDPDPALALDSLRQDWPQAEIRQSKGQTARRVQDIFQNTGAPIHLWVKGTNFQVNVWRALLSVPFGEVTTYKRIADEVGSPSAARAVGQALAANPVGYVIPCHRVIRSLGALGGYRWGLARKHAILAREHCRASTDENPRSSRLPNRRLEEA